MQCFLCSRCTRCGTSSCSPVYDASFRRAQALLAWRMGLVWPSLDDSQGVLLFNDEVPELQRQAALQGIVFHPVPLIHCMDECSNDLVVLAWRFGSSICPFLDGGSCRAYEVRPLVCRSFTLSKAPGLQCFEISNRCSAVVDSPGMDVSPFPDKRGVLGGRMPGW